MSEPASHRALEHTADVGIEVEAPSLETLYAEAAIALCDTLTHREAVRTSIEREIAVEATDGELLLVDFLNEVLFLFDTEALVFSSAEVRLLRDSEPSAVGLRATLGGERYDGERHPLRSLVKAVTYHGLRVWRDGERWRARVLFDL